VEQRRVRRYYLHGGRSQKAMKRLREKIKACTGRNRAGVRDIRTVIEDVNPVLRSWGNRATGFVNRACTGCVAPSDIRGRRNTAKKIIGKPCAGNRTHEIERGMGRRIRKDTAPPEYQ
jgi:hypothetical protein